MDKLIRSKCEVCQVGSPKISRKEITELKPQIPNWDIIKENGINKLFRVFTFNNFQEAIYFTNLIAEIAEVENHHPSILTEWGKVTVIWWTHKIKGLHKNDFIMASKTDAVLDDLNPFRE